MESQARWGWQDLWVYQVQPLLQQGHREQGAQYKGQAIFWRSSRSFQGDVILPYRAKLKVSSPRHRHLGTPRRNGNNDVSHGLSCLLQAVSAVLHLILLLFFLMLHLTWVSRSDPWVTLSKTVQPWAGLQGFGGLHAEAWVVESQKHGQKLLWAPCEGVPLPHVGCFPLPSLWT